MYQGEKGPENLLLHLEGDSVSKSQSYHTPKQFQKIDAGILEALKGQPWMNVKQISRKMAESRIYAKGQCIRQRCELLEMDGKIQRMDYNRGKGSCLWWRLVE